ncbi:hypothetical protein D9615_009755 [Tricholomella constricta]|uniref:Fido domain-containing protein n=1 Tax=Tricholomella constricta TaxID=117010 RepID=A0A8H5GSY8_9AGAR|nr:hypothetical protein D9615_009755 [Tricholomella constricta]
MPDPHIAHFQNDSRPQLEHPALTEIPVATLGLDLSSKLQRSLRVNSDNLHACGVSGAFWETLLEQHRIPYLLLRVADMRYTLNSKASSMKLYRELGSMINDPGLDKWIEETSSGLLEQQQKELAAFKYTVMFTPSQRWRPTAGVDSFPYCRLTAAQVTELREMWISISPAGDSDIMDKYQNLHCLETNSLEGTVSFSEASAISKLVQVGFYNQAEAIVDERQLVGAVRDRADAIMILQDTHQALDDIFQLAQSEPVVLTPAVLCRLHKILMRNSRISYTKASHGRNKLTYLNIGMTRQASSVNVTVTQHAQNLKVQFCPYDEVDQELEMFCKRFNELLQNPDAYDPFAAAAWSSHVFLTIHPFEDGNGRLSRIISSIPLLKARFPPLCILSLYKQAYINHLNSVRANRDGDYSGLMAGLYEGTKASVRALKTIIESES